MSDLRAFADSVPGARIGCYYYDYFCCDYYDRDLFLEWRELDRTWQTMEPTRQYIHNPQLAHRQ